LLEAGDDTAFSFLLAWLRPQVLMNSQAPFPVHRVSGSIPLTSELSCCERSACTSGSIAVVGLDSSMVILVPTAMTLRSELLLERDAAIQRLTIERDQLVVHSEAIAPLGLRAMCNRHYLVLAVEREPEPERGVHQLDDLRCQWGGALCLHYPLSLPGVVLSPSVMYLSCAIQPARWLAAAAASSSCSNRTPPLPAQPRERGSQR
jgi:hypothetical protein